VQKWYQSLGLSFKDGHEGHFQIFFRSFNLHKIERQLTGKMTVFFLTKHTAQIPLPLNVIHISPQNCLYLYVFSFYFSKVLFSKATYTSSGRLRGTYV
jgi:hypothetical protein